MTSSTVRRICESLLWLGRLTCTAPFDDDAEPPAAKISKYHNLNAFMALLWSRNLIEGYDFALWQLRDAFEEDIANETQAEHLAGAAAFWAIYAGSRLRQLVVDPPKLSGPEERSLGAGAKFGGASGYSEERWAFWLKGFEARAGSDSVGGQLAQRAVSVMKGLEP